jgi:hypothetical protein
MKNKEFKPIVIGYDESSKKRFEANLTALSVHLKDFFTECEKYVQIEDKNVYKGNLLNSFISDFSKKYKTQFSELLTIDKILELSNVDTHKLRFLESKIKEINIEIDYNTHKAETPDFSIKTNSIEENLLWNYANNLSKAIHENMPNGITFFYSDLQRGFANVLLYDFSTQRLVPNVSYIKGGYRRI